MAFPSRSSAPVHSIQAKKIQQKAYDGWWNLLFCALQHQWKWNSKVKKHFLSLLPEFVNCLLSHGRGAAFFVEPNSGMLGPFETQTINITAFTNMWGNYQDNLICKVCHKTIKLLISLLISFSNQTAELQWILTEFFFQVGDLDTTPIPIKMSVKGCPIYFQMIGPQPDNQNQGPIIRSVYYRMLKMFVVYMQRLFFDIWLTGLEAMFLEETLCHALYGSLTPVLTVSHPPHQVHKCT